MTKLDGCYYNSQLVQVLEEIKLLILDDFDTLLIVDGEVGAGKSVLAMQICKFVDPNFSVKNIAFSGRDFRKLVFSAARGSAVLFDEAMSGLHNRSSMNKENKLIVQMLAEVRQKNLFMVLCLPSFFDLDRSVAIHRSRALIHCYTDQRRRGRFLFFGRSRKTKLYVDGRKYYSYRTTHSWGHPGDFTGRYVVDEVAYRASKKAALSSYVSEEESLSRREIERLLRADIATRIYGLGRFTQDEVAGFLGISVRTLRNYLSGKQQEEISV